MKKTYVISKLSSLGDTYVGFDNRGHPYKTPDVNDCCKWATKEEAETAWYRLIKNIDFFKEFGVHQITPQSIDFIRKRSKKDKKNSERDYIWVITKK